MLGGPRECFPGPAVALDGLAYCTYESLPYCRKKCVDRSINKRDIDI